jgi:phage shock protein PspC (stress-responsive transcriptional regulator)
MSKFERQNGVIAGVCGGLAKQMNIDPWIVRVGVILICLFTVVGIVPVAIAYIIGANVLPKADELPPGQQPGSIGGNGPTATNTGTVFCGSCGTKNSPSNKFCQSCGNGL